MRAVDKKTNCWSWDGSCDSAGYPQIRLNKRLYKVSRVIAALCLGLHLHEKKTWVLHKCDNTSCFNPDHLFLGDRITNIQDMLKKGRQKKIRHEPNVRDLKVLRLRMDGATYREIGKRLHISTSYAGWIYDRFHTTYRHRAIERVNSSLVNKKGTKNVKKVKYAPN